MKRTLAGISLLVAVVLAASGCPTDPPAENSMSNNSTTTGECTPGQRVCQDMRTLETCARTASGEPRLVTTTCRDDELCQNGDCVEAPRDCSDTCAPPETRCTAAGEVETCADHNGDGCVEFGGSRACDAGQVCDPADGLCKAPTCSDACTQGETSCEDDLITTCVEGADTCLAFGPAKECPEGQACAAGECVAATSCDDECTEGEMVCSAGGELRTCITDGDADSCTEFGAGVACSAGQVCRQGACVAENTCQDQCVANETICVANQIASCETNSDGCLEFNTPMDCPAGQTCQNMGNGNVMCATVVVTGDVVINEVFYDANLADYRGVDGSPTFIELSGPPGLPVGDFTVELVNGSTGVVYGSFQLPPDARLDGNGFAVVTTDEPDNFLGLALPFFTNIYPIMTGNSGSNDVLQNGEDNVRLLNDSGTEVDAVGYGDFSGGSTFVGEGNAAGDVAQGHSLGRDANSTDTDDNAADFKAYFPTPSLPNSDLLINEVYVDQPGVDDSSETFIELMAPILGWEDLPLDGYVVRAINGFNGDDYISTGALPGIVLAGTNLNDGASVGLEAGYVVICNVNAPDILVECTALYDGVDFQNGPDNFVLEYDGRVIDAIGYGSFGAGETFVGEGSPAPYSQANSGKSLSRWPIFDVSRDLDTDDNAADFFIVDPTPGNDNPLP